MKQISAITFLIFASLAFEFPANAQVTYTGMSIADAFLATGSPVNPVGTNLTELNFGGAGTLVVAPASSGKGEAQSLVRFSVSEATNLFRSTYGSNWMIASVSLELTSNYGTAGVQPNNPIFDLIQNGNFVIEWISADIWTEGSGTPAIPTTDGITYNDLASLLSAPREVLSTNAYAAPGNNVHITWSLPLNHSLVNDIAEGGEVTFRFYAADSEVYYLFNSYRYGRGNEPLIHITAIPVLKIISSHCIDGNFSLTAEAQPNTQYLVQAGSDLPATTNWQTIGTVTADNAGVIRFEETVSQAARFYRLVK